MWCEFQQTSGVLWIMAMTRGKVIPPAENGFITFRRLSTPFALGPPAQARLNGDDRMAADPEQLRVPPNSARDLLRQATRFLVTLITFSNTSNNADLQRPSVTTRGRLVPRVPASFHDAGTRPSILVMSAIFDRNGAGNSRGHA